MFMKEKRVVMKLILICSNWFGKFVPNVMLPLLHRGYCIEFIVFWERIGGAGNAMKATARWVGFWSGHGSLVLRPGFQVICSYYVAT